MRVAAKMDRLSCSPCVPSQSSWSCLLCRRSASRVWCRCWCGLGGKRALKSGCALCKLILCSRPSTAMSRRSVGGARLWCAKAS